VHVTAGGSIYRAGLALLDLEDPTKVRRRCDEWLLGPHEEYEVVGDVSQVVFPCGWVVDEATGELRVYYGAADTSVCLATARLQDVMDHVLASAAPSTHRVIDEP
jgi:predicted GH43/DUF377 family glycosyl hydrolase